jgi:hypothetical protein
VHRPGRHPTQAEKPTSRRTADHEVVEREASCQTLLFEGDVVASQPEDGLMNRHEELPAQKLRAATASDAGTFELVDGDEPVLMSSGREHGGWNWRRHPILHCRNTTWGKSAAAT